jgi:hypothetical protein
MPGRKNDAPRLPQGRERKHSRQEFKTEECEGRAERCDHERQEQTLAAALSRRRHVWTLRPGRRRLRVPVRRSARASLTLSGAGRPRPAARRRRCGPDALPDARHAVARARAASSGRADGERHARANDGGPGRRPGRPPARRGPSGDDVHDAEPRRSRRGLRRPGRRRRDDHFRCDRGGSTRRARVRRCQAAGRIRGRCLRRRGRDPLRRGLVDVPRIRRPGRAHSRRLRHGGCELGEDFGLDLRDEPVDAQRISGRRASGPDDPRGDDHARDDAGSRPPGHSSRAPRGRAGGQMPGRSFQALFPCSDRFADGNFRER